MKYRCGKCGKEYEWQFSPLFTERFPEEILYDRGYWWHKQCAPIIDDREIDFPSLGALIPDTIREEKR